MVDIKSVKRKYAGLLLALKNVRMVSIGWKNGVKGELAIIVSVTTKLPETLLSSKDIVPQALDGFQTDVVQVDEILTHENTERNRQPGFSIGNTKVTVGTLGCIVQRYGRDRLLSNAHVFVHDPTIICADDEDIVQPGSYDGGTYPDDYVGHLDDYVRIVPFIFYSECWFTKGITWFLNKAYGIFRRRSFFRAMVVNEPYGNRVDAALAVPTEEFEKEVINLGVPQGITEGILGMKVAKSGRTTETTYGVITQIDAVLTISYGGIKMALFRDQLVITGEDNKPFSAGGDSGSIVFGPDGKLVGLLFAGSSEVTIVNRIQNVFDMLEVSL